MGFLVRRQSGHFLADAKSGLYDFDLVSGAFALIRDVEPQLPDDRLNDGAVDAKGRLWFGSIDDAEGAACGKLYRLDAGGLAAMDSGYVITNGPAFSPDGGPDLTTVYATTATKGLSPNDLAAHLLAGGLFRFTADVPGLLQNAIA